MKIKVFFIICIILSWGQLSFAQIGRALSIEESEVLVETVVTEGRGSNFESALSQALYLAVGQKNGTEIQRKVNVESIAAFASREKSLHAKGLNQSVRIDYEAFYNIANLSESSVVGGVIDSFKVLHIEEPEVGLLDSWLGRESEEVWRVEVKSLFRQVQQATYKRSNTADRIKILISEPTYSNKTNYILQASDAWKEKLVQILANSGRVAVINRENDAFSLKELELLKNDSFQKEQTAKLGQRLGADYILVSEIKLSELYRDKHKFKLSDKVVEGPLRSSFKVNYSLVELATGVIESSSEEEALKVENTSIKQLANISAQNAANKLIQTLFPAKIEAVSGDYVYIALSTGASNVGDLFDVYLAGDDIFDSYTGERLGSTETYIGHAEIVEITSRLIKGKLYRESEYIYKKTDELFVRRK